MKTECDSLGKFLNENSLRLYPSNIFHGIYWIDAFNLTSYQDRDILENLCEKEGFKILGWVNSELEIESIN